MTSTYRPAVHFWKEKLTVCEGHWDHRESERRCSGSFQEDCLCEQAGQGSARSCHEQQEQPQVSRESSYFAQKGPSRLITGVHALPARRTERLTRQGPLQQDLQEPGQPDSATQISPRPPRGGREAREHHPPVPATEEGCSAAEVEGQQGQEGGCRE